MPELHGPWLEIAIFVPLVVAIILAFVQNEIWRWRVSSFVAVFVLAITVIDWIDFLSLHTFEAHDPHSLTQSLFGREIITVDEFNAPLLALASLLYFLVIALTPSSKQIRFPHSLTLVSMTLLLTLFSSREPWLIVVVLTLQSILPMVELKQRKQTWQFFAAHQALAALMVVTGWLISGLEASAASPGGILIMSLGLLIRCGSVPLHCWMIDLFDRASLGTALLFVTPMAGAYGLVRLVLPVAPEWILQFITLLALISAIYSSGMVLVQNCTRRFYCYLFLANSSLMLVGLESLTAIGLTGSLSLWLSINISLLSLGITIRALEGRVGRVTVERFHGLYHQMPLLASFFLLATLASIGFPGTVGFVGVELLVECAIRTQTVYGVIVLGAVAINGIAALRVYFRLFTGKTASASISLQPKPLEKLAILVLGTLIMVGGVFPQPGVQSRYHAASELLNRRENQLGKTKSPGQSPNRSPNRKSFKNNEPLKVD